MAVFQGSRYVKTSAYFRNGDTLILDIRKRHKFNASESTYYTVVQGDSVEGIAFKQYGNAQFWWAIMDANPLYQSQIEIKPGDVLMIPPLQEVVRVSE